MCTCLELAVADSRGLPLSGALACWNLGRSSFAVDPGEPPTLDPERAGHVRLTRALWFRNILFFYPCDILVKSGGDTRAALPFVLFEFRTIHTWLTLQSGTSRVKSEGNGAVGAQKPGSVAARRGLQAAGAINYFALFIRCTQRPLASKHICKCLQGKRKTNDSCHQSLQSVMDGTV